MKILHFLPDDKFFSLIRKVYEEAFPGRNAFRVLRGPRRSFGQIRESSDVRKVREAYFASKKLREESKDFDLLVVHSMTRAFARGIQTAGPGIFTVWCGWGYDYYYLLEEQFGNLYLPETKLLHEEIQRRSGGIRAKLRAMFPNRKKEPQSEPLLSVMDRIHLFSILRTEVDMVKNALPRLGAVYYELPYYTTEDVLAKGPGEMSGSDILLGNSLSATNNHIEALRALRRVLNGERNIIVPLSYGPERARDYTDRVCKIGNELFGGRFKPLRTWLPIERYHDRLAHCGIVVMNHRRQQAIGNISAALYKGAKVFLRPENPVYRWYSAMGAKVFSVDDLEEPGSLAEGLEEADRQRNRRIVGELWSKKNVLKAICGLSVYVNEYKATENRVSEKAAGR